MTEQTIANRSKALGGDGYLTLFRDPWGRWKARTSVAPPRTRGRYLVAAGSTADAATRALLRAMPDPS